MALIGSTVDPRMFVQDYSGFANAAAIQAAGMMNFGQQVGGAISDYAKESKALKAEIAKGKSALQFAKAYHPELADQIDQLGSVFNDPTKSVVEQAAAGSQMGDFVAAILGGEQFKKQMAFKEKELGVEESILNAKASVQPSPLSKPFPVDDGKGGQVWMQYNEKTGQTVPAKFTQYEDPTLLDLPAQDANGNPIEQAADMWGADGGVLPDKGAIGNSIAGAARLGYKPPEGGAGQVMTGDEVAKLVDQGMEFKAEPAGSGQFRVTEVKGSAVSKPQNGVVMSSEEVAKLKSDGFNIEGEPVEGGKFRVKKVDTGKANLDKVLDLVGKAHALAKEGKRDEAIMIFQALGFNAFGMPPNIDTIETYVPGAGEPLPGTMPDTGTTPTPRIPLSERLKLPVK